MAQKAEIVITFSSLPTAGEYVSWDCNGQSYTFTAVAGTPASSSEFTIGNTITTTLVNLKDAINAVGSSIWDVDLDLTDSISVTAKYYGDRWNFTNVDNFGSSSFNVTSNLSNVTLAMSVSAEVTDNLCYGVQQGSVELTVTGGEWPFVYTWAKDGVAMSEDTRIISGLDGADYAYTVTDYAGTVISDSATVNEPDSGLEATYEVHNVLCNNAFNGSILLDVSGGTAPYSYLWSNGATTNDLLNVGPGTYSVTITDNLGCQLELSGMSITEPDQIVIVAEVQDVDVTLTVTGGTAPYSFSWSNGTTTQNQENLSPGQYVVTVTDLNGCVQTATVTIQESKFYFSQNPVTLKLVATEPENKENLSFINEVWFQSQYPNGDFARLGIEEHPADDSGGTVFNVESYLDAFLNAYVPSPSLGSPVLAAGVFGQFYLRFTERYGDPATEAPYTQQDTRVVLMGGLNYIAYALGNFYQKAAQKLIFLSWSKSSKPMLPNQPDYLFVMVTIQDLTTIKVMLSATKANGSTQEIEKYSITGIQNRYEVYCFPVGIEALGISDDVIAYDIWIENEAGLMISEKRSYEVDEENHEHVRYLAYKSSLGGISTIAITGKATRTLKKETEIMSPFLDHDYALKDLGEKTIYRTGQNEIKFMTGYIIDDAYFQSLEDMLMSDEYYLLENYTTGKKWVPVRVEFSNPELEDETRLDALNVIKGTIYLPNQRNYTPKL